MIPLKVRLQRRGVDTLGVQRLGQRGFNALVREQLVGVALYWTKTFLPQHFDPQGRRRYHYARRTARYEARKQRLAERGYRPMRVGQNYAIVQAGGFIPQDLVWTGAMRATVLQHSYRPQATATAKRIRVRVPVPLGHPVQRQTAAEVTKLLQSELAEMHRLAFQRIVAEMTRQGVFETAEATK